MTPDETIKNMFDILPPNDTQTTEEEKDNAHAYTTIIQIIESINAYQSSGNLIRFTTMRNEKKTLYAIVMPFTIMPFMSTDLFDVLGFCLGVKSGYKLKGLQ